MAEILCIKCNQLKPTSHFYKNGKDYWTRECKECKATRQRLWRKNNPEESRRIGRQNARNSYQRHKKKRNERTRLWYAANAEIAKAKRREKHRLNPEYDRDIAQRWRESHREQSRATARSWHWANRDLAIKKCREWKLKNTERVKLHRLQGTHIRRARILNNGNERFSLDDIVKRDGYTCHICGGHVHKKDLSFDHLIPISKGGPHVKSNVAVAHWLCNVKRGAGRIPAQLLLIG